MKELESSSQKPRSRWSGLKLPILIIASLVVAMTCILSWHLPRGLEAARAETIVIGNEIVKALDSYFGEHDIYPGSLETLVPKYLDEIKTPIWGEAWQYELYPNSKAFVF